MDDMERDLKAFGRSLMLRKLKTEFGFRRFLKSYYWSVWFFGL